MKQQCSLAVLLILLLSRLCAADTSYFELVQNVNQLVCPGVPGSVWACSDSWVPIVGDDSSYQPPVHVLAREYGTGRIVVFGHDGILSSTNYLDNGTFTINVFGWLCNTKPKAVGYISGWLNPSPGSNLYNTLTSNTYSIVEISRPITAVKLSEIPCFMVGNTWTDFSNDEIAAVQQYVQNGGGLLLCGLGWSWTTYHPQMTIEDYPMMKLAAPYEVRWIDNYLTTKTQYNGYPVFNIFYPQTFVSSVSDALSTISNINQAYPDTLPYSLQIDPNLRESYVRANMLLTLPVNQFPIGHPDRNLIYNYYRQTSANYPTYFTRTAYYNPSQYPCFVQIRERIFRTLIDAKEINSITTSEIASSLQLTGRYFDIWNKYAIFLLDNNRLSESQKNFIYNYFSLIPKGIDNLRFISVRDFLGTFSYGIDLSGKTSAVNIFGFPLGGYQGNSFPPDGEIGLTDVFSIVVAHEHNHVVDGFTISGLQSSTLNQRRYALIEQATPADVIFYDHANGLGVDWNTTKTTFRDRGLWDGDENHWQTAWNNYWASGNGYDANSNWLRNNLQLMCEAPQESFATLANQYFTDTIKMLNLAITRWQSGRKMCINQFLFFVDIYSQNTLGSYMYKISTDGSIVRLPMILKRNASGFIKQITFNNVYYEFEYNAQGAVADIQGPRCRFVELADLNEDCNINLDDYVIIAKTWLNACSYPNWCHGADINHDGFVEYEDLWHLSVNWLKQNNVIAFDGFDSSPNWQIEGQWQFGQPNGMGGSEFGYPDPATGYNGWNVYGVNLDGDYSWQNLGKYSLTSKAFDCSGFDHIVLRFARWLNSDEHNYVNNAIEVSNDGINWHTVWNNAKDGFIEENSWHILEYDISSYADNQPTVYVRWSYQVLNRRAFGAAGWNIDDFALIGRLIE